MRFVTAGRTCRRFTLIPYEAPPMSYDITTRLFVWLWWFFLFERSK